MNFTAPSSNVQILDIVSETAATVNISARSMASFEMQKAFLAYANYGFHKARENPQIKELNIEKVPFVTEKQIPERIKQTAIMKLQEKLKYFKKYNVCSVIIDVGTVRKFHTLEVILTLPGVLDPIPYRSVPCKNLTHAGYMKITKKITKLLAKDEITVASFVGDNLKAQKLALDHTNIKCIQNHDETCRSILFSPCLNHTLNLAVKDMIHTISIFENSHDIATLFLKFFKEKEIQRMHKFSFALCEQRWLYLYDTCLYLLTNNNIISKIVSDERYQAVLTRNSYERLNESVPYYVYFTALLLQLLKILSKRL